MAEILNSKVFGEGKPLVILHGLFGMLDNWQSLAKQFGQFFEIHIVDQRNHGKSFHDSNHTYELMSADLLRYLDAKGLDRISLLGHSMGGKTAMLFASLHPERVEKLVVVDIAPKHYEPHHQEILKGLHAVANSGAKSRNEADQVLSAHFSEPGIRQFLLKNLYRANDGEMKFKFNLKALGAEIENVGEALYEKCVFKGPTLFIDGQNSDYITSEDEALIEKHFPDSEITEIENAGHWVHAENPKKFFEVVSRFFIY